MSACCSALLTGLLVAPVASAATRRCPRCRDRRPRQRAARSHRVRLDGVHGAAAPGHHARWSPSTAPAATTRGSPTGAERRRVAAAVPDHRRPDRLQRAGPPEPHGCRAPARPRSAPTGCPARSACTPSARAGTTATAGSAAATTGCSTTSPPTTTATATSRQGGFRWRLPASHPDGSERLKDYPQQYEFVVRHQLQPEPGPAPRRRDLPARQRQRRHRRLRVAPRARFMRRLMVRLDQDRAPVIAIGR